VITALEGFCLQNSSPSVQKQMSFEFKTLRRTFGLRGIRLHAKKPNRHLKKRCSDQNGCLVRPGSSEGWRDHPAELGIHAEQVAGFFNSLDFLFTS
jgi:hypothetical protein